MTTNKVCPCCKRAFRDSPKPPAGSPGPLFRKVVIDALQRDGVTNTELAERLGVHASRVTQYLRSNNLTERVFKDIVSALGLDLEVRLVKRRARS